MAGRPKSKAKKVTALEEQALDLAMGVVCEVPTQYRDNPNLNDPICQAWNDSLNKIMEAFIALERLGEHLRAKAGITDPSPFEQLRRKMKAPLNIAFVRPEHCNSK